MPRPYIQHTIDDLERLVKENLHQTQVLADIRDELTFRNRPRARALQREIEGIFSKRVPQPPRPPRENRPEDQLDILE